MRQKYLLMAGVSFLFGCDVTPQSLREDARHQVSVTIPVNYEVAYRAIFEYLIGTSNESISAGPLGIGSGRNLHHAIFPGHQQAEIVSIYGEAGSSITEFAIDIRAVDAQTTVINAYAYNKNRADLVARMMEVARKAKEPQ